MRKLLCVILFTMPCVIYGLFAIKNKVIDISARLVNIQLRLEKEKNEIYTLKAELTYLQSPDRLTKLANKYLDLKPMKTAQMTADPIIIQNIPARNRTNLANKSRNRGQATKWRYRRTVENYVRTVSGSSK